MVSRIFPFPLQLRRQARLRREYLYRKGVEERERAIQDKKDRLKSALDNNTVLDGDLRNRVARFVLLSAKSLLELVISSIPSFMCPNTSNTRRCYLRRDAIELAKKAKWDDEGPQRAEAEGDGGGGVASRDSQGRSSMQILDNSVLNPRQEWD